MSSLEVVYLWTKTSKFDGLFLQCKVCTFLCTPITIAFYDLIIDWILNQLNWQVKKIFAFLKNGFQDISNSLDLSFEDDSVADEKIPFLAYLASVLKENLSFQYELPSGSKRFRDLIAGFMRTYHHVPISADVRSHLF